MSTFAGQARVLVRLPPPPRDRHDSDVDTYPCPVCRTIANLGSGCPGCSRAPDPDAAEVIRIDSQIRELTIRRLGLAARVRSQVQAEAAAAAARTLPQSPPPEPAPEPVPTGPETSLVAVQSVLFMLGGLLLAIGAIVFTAVAWVTFGERGRAVILAGYTVLALAAPLVARRRGLVATAETFAAVGLLLVALDGYAVRAVNLWRLGELPQLRFAGVVCGVTAVVAAGYAARTGLTGPRLVALLAAQPVGPLLVADLRPSIAQWALIAAAVTAGNLVVPWRGTGNVLRIAGWLAHGVAGSVAMVLALAAVFVARDGRAAAIAGTALMLSALVLLAGSLLSRRSWHQGLTGATAVTAGALAAGQFVTTGWPDIALVLVAGVVAALAALAAAIGPLVGQPMRLGIRIGAWLGIATVGCYAAVLVLIGAIGPVWAAWTVRYDWQLPATLVLLTAGAAALLIPRVGPAVAVGAMLTALALPASFQLAWWAPSTVDMAVAATLAVWAAYRNNIANTVGAAVLVGHAVLAGLPRLESTAAVLGALVLLAVAVGAPARRRSTVVGGVAVAVGMVAWPGTVAATLAAADVETTAVARLTLAAAALLLGPLLAVRRWWPEYRGYSQVALYLAVTTVGLVAGRVEPGAPVGVYAATALLVFAAAAMPDASRYGPLRLLGSVPSLVAVAVTSAAAVLTVFLLPYAWLGAIWTGRPSGLGLSFMDIDPIDGAAALALWLTAGAIALGWRAYGRTAIAGGLAVGAAAVPVTVAAAGLSWPAVPVVTLCCGALGALAVARVRGPVPLPALGIVPLIGAGLAGALPTKASTLLALAGMVAVTLVVAAVGRTPVARDLGSMAAVAAAVTLAAAGALAAGALPRTAALWVVVTSAVALAAAAARRSAATEICAHLGAVTGLAMTIGSASYAAAVCTLWGVAVGLRALWPGESHRVSYAAAAAGSELLAWWLLLGANEVALVEAYTLPAAAVAMAVGWLALRSRPALRSWVAYGPALAAASLPSLATVLIGPGEPLRRLLLGVGAVAVVSTGAVYRRQAPVVVGGVVAALVALHELVLVWQKLPTWLPTTVAGLVLIGLAITFERRRRDMTRLRDALAKMT